MSLVFYIVRCVRSVLRGVKKHKNILYIIPSIYNSAIPLHKPDPANMISTSALLQKLGIDQRPMWLGEEDPRGNKYGRGGYHEHKYRKAGYPENKYKRACYGGVICTIVVLFLVLSVRNTSDILESLGPWTYDSTRDANNYALTAEQCDSAFPDLYKPIHEIFTNLGRDIELNDTIGSIHWGEGRAMLYDNQVRIVAPPYFDSS